MRERRANGWELTQKGSNEINIFLPPLLLPHRALRPIAILHFDSGCKLDESGSTSEQQVRQRRGTRQMASLFRQFLSPLHLSVELSIVLSIERPGYLQKAHSSHWKYRTGRRFGHQISLFHSPSPLTRSPSLPCTNGKC